MIPTTVSIPLVKSVSVGLESAQTPTPSGNVHQAWEGNDPVAHSINDEAAVELEERLTLDTQASDWHKDRTHQEAICQPLVQKEHNAGNNIDRLRVDEDLVSEKPRR